MRMVSDVFWDAKEAFRDFEKIVKTVETFMVAHTKAALHDFAARINRIESRTKEFVTIRDNYLDKYGLPTTTIDLDEFLRDANDLIGVRVVAYYNADVDDIRDSLRDVYPDAELEEKLTVHDINRGSRFGYRAVHLNFEFSDNRIFRGQRRSCAGVEIQIRTILSDAWARHSHKLVYKSDSPPSDEVLRGFAGTAAMLETLDGQIERIRNLPQTPERKQPSVELDWVATNDVICNLIGTVIDEENLKAFYIAAQDNSQSKNSTGFPNGFLEEARKAWKLYGNVDYEKYGFKDGVLKLKIALYGSDRDKFGWVIPLHMKAKVDNVLQVGARGA